ncbi:hypothetical protein MKX01_041095 [Papaver californicum]|nr:hypothetical protein MKX01_041095 [Papaver californicum]
MGENSKSVKIMDALIDMPPQELETPVQIFIIPSYVKERNPDVYQPKMVSIGPYHYGKPELEPMQSHKNRAVYQFLKRSPTGATVEKYVDELKLVYDRLWGSYEQDPQLGNWTPDDFIKLMMVDGIFLLEFLNVLHGNRKGNDYADTDPIFGKRGHILKYSYVIEDLLLLENQVPYLVLSILLTVSEGWTVEDTENNLARLMLTPPAIKGHHLLDMYIKGTLGRRERQEAVTGEGAVKPVATYKDIKFRKKANSLHLPTIFISQGTVPRFYNLKAYQLIGDTSKELISYIHLLNFFIRSADDVNSLRSQGIIVSSLDSDEAVITVMKELTRDTMVENIDDKSAGLIKQVKKYYDKKTKVYNWFGWVTRRWAFAILGTLLYVIHFLDSLYAIRYYRDYFRNNYY